MQMKHDWRYGIGTLVFCAFVTGMFLRLFGPS